MDLIFRINCATISKVILIAVLISTLPVVTGTTSTSSAASLASTQPAISCASTVSDSSTARLDVIINGNYCVLRFLSSVNTWTPPSGVSRFEYLAIGGGGGGGGGRGGGGGAGGFVTGSSSVNSQVQIRIGNGGAGGVSVTSGSRGESSTITIANTSIYALGGGGGGAPFTNANTYPATNGGSGGGAGVYASSSDFNTQTGYAGGAGTENQGFAGASSGGTSGSLTRNYSVLTSSDSCLAASWDLVRNTGGGGGAGGLGFAGRGGTKPNTAYSCVTAQTPDGGEGKVSSITGSPVFYAGGGGGSAGRFNKTSENNNYYTAGGGIGGSGIGGNGSPIDGTNGNPGAVNTGSGGGGGGNSQTDSGKGACAITDNDESCDGGAGGSGIVVIRFLRFFNNATECSGGVSDTSSAVFTATTLNGECLLTFTTPDSATTGANSWTVPAGVTRAWMVVVGAGGGGGNDLGGGGGGGRVIDSSTVVLTQLDSLTIRIGKGGDNQGGSYALGTRMAGGYTGESTTVKSSKVEIVSLGGGGAVSRQTTLYNSTSDIPKDTSGWTGGGAGKRITAASNGGVGGVNFKGGNAPDSGVADGVWAGGGGGAGGAGVNGGFYGTRGGVGQTTFITGSELCLGGGGGGGAGYRSDTGDFGAPGTATCGGGAGKNANSAYSNFGTSGTGGGGGGGYESADGWGGRGGSGILIIRFTLATSNQPTRDLNMACHAFSSSTSTSEAVTSGFFGTPFTSDSGTTEFSFPTSSGSEVSQDWGGSGPAGCSSSGDHYTVYISGYIRGPKTGETVWFAMNSDDGARLNVRGSTVVEDVRDRGFGNGLFTPTRGFIMEANSWHYIQIWLHENSGAAGLNLYWQTGSMYRSDSWQLVPRANISRTVPRTVTFDTSKISNAVLTTTIDTDTVVYGGPNEVNTFKKSTGGTFTFYESGTAISGCSAVVAVLGQAQCNLASAPTANTPQYYRVEFTPETSTMSNDINHNVYAPTFWTEVVTLGKTKNAKLMIGQYIAFTGLSSYPLNVYGDGTIYGAITRSLIDSGTANCALDASKYFLTASRVGSCSVAASAAGDATHEAETTTATIYWVQWSDAYATRVASTPTEIVLQHQTQIIRHAYETLTVTSYTDTATVPNTITSARPGQTIRILGTGFVSTDTTSQATFTDNEYADRTDLTNDYIQVVVPDGAVTGPITVDTLKGTALGPTLTITSP